MEKSTIRLLLADRQDITRAGILYLTQHIEGARCEYVPDKTSLINKLRTCGADCVVVLDYTLFDIRDVEELIILQERFPEARWLLFSDELSPSFVHRTLAASEHFSIVGKDSSLAELREALRLTVVGRRFICQQAAAILAEPEVQEEHPILTKTEAEVLRCIAQGMTTREIAEKRFSSFHTVNTHRKNIFRKLGVNNVHEAIKYALRAGLVDSAEYYI